MRTIRGVRPERTPNRAPNVRPSVRANANKVFNDTRSELRKISWPSREEIVRLTLVVIALSIFLAIFLGVIVDGLFSLLYRQIVGL